MASDNKRPPITKEELNRLTAEVLRSCDPVAGQRFRLDHQPLISDPVLGLDGFKDVLALLSACRFDDIDESQGQSLFLTKFVLPLHARMDAENRFSHLPWRRPAMAAPVKKRRGLSIVSEPQPMRRSPSRPRSQKRPLTSLGSSTKSPSKDDPIAELNRELSGIREGKPEMLGRNIMVGPNLTAPSSEGLPFTKDSFAEVLANANPVVTSGLFELYANTMCLIEAVPLVGSAKAAADFERSQNNASLIPSVLQNALGLKKDNQTAFDSLNDESKITTSALALSSIGSSRAPFMSIDAFFQCMTDLGISPGYCKDEILSDIFSRCCKKRAPPPDHSTVRTALGVTTGLKKTKQDSNANMIGKKSHLSAQAASAAALIEARRHLGTVGGTATGIASVVLESTLNALEFSDAIAMAALASAAEVKVSQPERSPLLDLTDSKLGLKLMMQWGLDDEEMVDIMRKRLNPARKMNSRIVNSIGSDDKMEGLHNYYVASTSSKNGIPPYVMNASNSGTTPSLPPYASNAPPPHSMPSSTMPVDIGIAHGLSSVAPSTNGISEYKTHHHVFGAGNGSMVQSDDRFAHHMQNLIPSVPPTKIPSSVAAGTTQFNNFDSNLHKNLVHTPPKNETHLTQNKLNHHTAPYLLTGSTPLTRQDPFTPSVISKRAYLTQQPYQYDFQTGTELPPQGRTLFAASVRSPSNGSVLRDTQQIPGLGMSKTNSYGGSPMRGFLEQSMAPISPGSKFMDYDEDDLKPLDNWVPGYLEGGMTSVQGDVEQYPSSLVINKQAYSKSNGPHPKGPTGGGVSNLLAVDPNYVIPGQTY